eukprot:31126-Pelagococcus_subviridis.AAC.5
MLLKLPTLNVSANFAGASASVGRPTKRERLNISHDVKEKAKKLMTRSRERCCSACETCDAADAAEVLTATPTDVASRESSFPKFRSSAPVADAAAEMFASTAQTAQQTASSASAAAAADVARLVRRLRGEVLPVGDEVGAAAHVRRAIARTGERRLGRAAGDCASRGEKNRQLFKLQLT